MRHRIIIITTIHSITILGLLIIITITTTIHIRIDVTLDITIYVTKDITIDMYVFRMDQWKTRADR